MHTPGSCKPSQPMPAHCSCCLSVPYPGAEMLTEWVFVSSHSDTTSAPQDCPGWESVPSLNGTSRQGHSRASELFWESTGEVCLSKDLKPLLSGWTLRGHMQRPGIPAASVAVSPLWWTFVETMAPEYIFYIYVYMYTYIAPQCIFFWGTKRGKTPRFLM